MKKITPRPTQGSASLSTARIDRRCLAAERGAILLNSDALLRLPEVCAVLGISRSTFWDGIRQGRYPKGLKVSARCTVWPAASIRAVIEATSKQEKG